MSGDLSAIQMRINKLKVDCVNPSSDFYKSSDFRAAEIERIDKAIQKIKDRCIIEKSAELTLEDRWSALKEHLWFFIETDQKVRSAEGDCEGKTIDLFLNELEHANNVKQRVLAVKAVWDTFKATRPNPSLKDFITFMAEPLQREIESMIGRERASSLPPVPASQTMETEEELAIAESQITLEEERAARVAEKRRLLFQEKPNIAKLIQFLALRLAGGEYGEKIKTAFLESHPSVITSSSLLKFLLLEAFNHSFIPHKLNQWEIELSDESWAKILRAKDSIGNDISQEIIEEVFLKEDPLSEQEERLLDELNKTVKGIQISREEEQLYGQFLRDILDASCAYKDVLASVDTLENPSEKIQALIEVVEKFESLDPQSYFTAIDRAIQAVNEDKTLTAPDRLIEVWLKNLCEELKEKPHIMTSFRGGEYLSDHLKLNKGEEIFHTEDARFSILLVAKLLRTDQSHAIELIAEVLKSRIEPNSFTLPVELFQMLLPLQPIVALQIAIYVPLRDRFQCFIQLMHIEKRSLDLDKLLDRTINAARDFLEQLLFQYLEEPIPENTKKLKTEMSRLLNYLTVEIGAWLPKEVKDLHPEGSPKEQIECALLADYLDPPTEKDALEDGYDLRAKIRILILPELVRIGKKEQALTLSQKDIDRIDDPNNQNLYPPIKELARSLLKASGFKSPWLDSHTLGPVSEPENPQSIPLDSSFIKRYFQVMKLAKDFKWAASELIHLSAAAHEISVRRNNSSYEDFALEAATVALKKIKGIKIPKRVSLESELNNVLTGINLIDHWIQNLDFIGPQEAQNIKRELEGKLFDLRKEYLKILTYPRDQIGCLIDLFHQSISVGKEEEGLGFARRALDLHTKFFRDQTTGGIDGPFIDLLSIAKANMEIILSREGEEARRLESEMGTFTVDLIDSLNTGNPLGSIYLSSGLLIETANALTPPSVEFFTQAGQRVLQSIQKLGSEESPALSFKKDLLIKLIRGFGDNAPEIISKAKNSLGDVLKKLCNTGSLDTEDPVKKLDFLESLVEGFELLENSGEVISLASQAFGLITPQDFLAQQSAFYNLVKGLIVYIKDLHDKGGQDLDLGPGSVGLRLIEVVLLEGLLRIEPKNDRILNLMKIYSSLISYGYKAESSLCKKFSRQAFSLALQEIKALKTIGNEEEIAQEELIGELIRITTPVDSVLAAQFRKELSLIQARRRRGEEGPDNPPNKRSNI